MNMTSTPSRSYILIVTCLAALATVPETRAVLAVSNLGEPADGTGFAMFGGSVFGMSFVAGNDSPFWIFDAVNLRAYAVGQSSAFAVRLHEDSGGLPGLLIGVLQGPAPVGLTPATYSYSPSNLTILTSGSTYWVSVASPFASGISDSNVWMRTAPSSGHEAGLAGWSLGDNLATSSNLGANWSINDFNPHLMALHANPVPEPTATVICALAAGLLCNRHRPPCRRERP